VKDELFLIEAQKAFENPKPSLLERCAAYVCTLAEMDKGAHYDEALHKLITELSHKIKAPEGFCWVRLLEGLKEDREDLAQAQRRCADAERERDEARRSAEHHRSAFGPGPLLPWER